MGLWNKIKSWFTGGAKKSAPSRTTTTTYRKPVRTQLPRYTSSPSSSGGAYRGGSGGRGQGEAPRREEPQRTVVKVENSNYSYKRANGVQNLPNEKQQQLKKAQADRQKRREAEDKKVNKFDKALGNEGKTKKQRQLEQKMQLNERTVKDAEYTAKEHPHLYAASRGAISGATLGGSKLLTKKLADERIRKSDEKYTKNQKGIDKAIELGGELAGNMVTYGATAGLSRSAGSKAFALADKASKGATTKGVAKLEKKLISRYGTKAGKKMLKALGTDASINATTGLVHNALAAANTEGDLGDKAKAFGTNVAMTAALGTGMTVGATRLGERATINAYRNLKEGAAKGSEGKNIANAVKDEYTALEDKLLKPSGKATSKPLTKEEIAARTAVDNEAKQSLENKVSSINELNRRTQREIQQGTNPERFARAEATRDLRSGAEIAQSDEKIATLNRADALYKKAERSEQKIAELRHKAARASKKSDRAMYRMQYEEETRKLNNYLAEANAISEKHSGYHNLETQEATAYGKLSNDNAMQPESVATPAPARQPEQMPPENAPLPRASENQGVILEPPRKATSSAPLENRVLQDAQADLTARENMFAGADDNIPFGDNRTTLDRQTDEITGAIEDNMRFTNKPIGNTKKTTKQMIQERAWRELPDDVEEARTVASEMPDTTAENKYVGEYKTAENECLAEYQKAAKEGNKQAMETAKAKAQAFRELDEGSEIAAQKIYSKEPMDFSAINKPLGGTTSDGVTPKESEAFIRHRNKWNDKLAPDQRISDTAESAFMSTNSDVERALYKKMYKDGAWLYDIAHNKEQLQKAITNVFDNETPAAILNKIANYVRTGANPNHKEYLSTIYEANVVREYLSMMVAESTGVQRQQAIQGMEVVNQYLATRVGVSGQILQAQKFYRYMSPSTRALTTKQGLAQLFKNKGIIESLEDFDKILAQEPQLTQYIDDIANGQTLEEIANAERQAKLFARSKVGRTWTDLWNEWRYTGMLTSVPTHARNIGGNLFNAVKGVADDSIAGLLQKSGAFYKGEAETVARTKSVNPLASVRKIYANKEGAGFKAMTESYKKNLPDMLAGAKYEDIKLNTEQVYKKGGKLVTKNKLVKLLDKISNFNTNMLNYEDELFMKANYEKQFAQVLDANKFGLGKEGGQVLSDEKILELAEKTAVNEALHMTFRDYSRTAQMLNEFVQKGANPNASAIEKIASKSLNITVPFVKTPINILKQSAVDNTVVGLVKGLHDLSKANSPELVDKALSGIAKGTTGTGIMALGIMLGMKDETEKFSITTNLSDSDRDKNFKQHGFKDYSIRIGDSSVPLAWLTPLSASFFIGGTMGKEMQKFNNRQAEKGNYYDSIASAGHVASAILEPLLETTMLSGLNTTLESATSDDEQNALINLMNGIKNNVISQSTPTLFKQVARTIAPYDYLYVNRAESKGGQDLEYMMKSNFKSLAAPITGRQEGGFAHMAAATDVRGNIRGEKTSAMDYAKSAALNLLSPTKPSKIQWDDTDTETLALYDELAKDPSETKRDTANQVFERNNYDTTVVAGKTKFDRTDDDISRGNQSKQRAGADAIASALETKALNKTNIRMTPEEKAEIINSAQGKSLHEAVGIVQQLPQYQGLSAGEKKAVMMAMMGDGSAHNDKGASSYMKKELYESRNLPKGQYEFDNEMTEKQQDKLKGVVDKIGYEKTMELVHAAQKVSYSDADSDNNGQRYVSYSRGSLVDTMNEFGLNDEDVRAVFYNALKHPRAKEYYTGMTADWRSGSGRGYRRGGHGYHRRGGHKSSKVQKPSEASKVYSGNYNYTKAPTTSATKSKAAKSKSVVTDAYIQKVLKQTKEKKK